MQEYGISKSTAIRDIQSLEEIGMPIFSETGRNGRYGILKIDFFHQLFLLLMKCMLCILLC